MRLLWQAAVDLKEPAEVAAYYAEAEWLIAAVIAAPARTYADAQVKAETAAWCREIQAVIGLDRPSERVLESLLRDLLAAAEPAEVA